MPLRHHRAELLAHLQQTNSQSHLPEIGTKLAYQAHRQGVAERCPEPAVHKRIAVALLLIAHDDQLRRDLELCLLTTAKPQDRNTRYRLRTIPGIGELLSLVRLYDIHAIQRFPRVQEFVSSCRFVKCARASAGKRSGTAGAKIGQAALTWAFSEAAGRLLRAHPTGQTSLARVEQHPSPGKAFTLLAHP
jgi:transposase